MTGPEEDDDARTVMRPASGTVAALGANEAPAFSARASTSSHTLPNGARVHDHEITGLIGEGGFGIVYLAYDHALQRRVAIKEYMPASMASRAAGSTGVVVKSERHLETFNAGLKSFVNEARLLARFDHPSLLKVYRFWEENGTAYMVMPYYEGPTLKQALARLGRAPDEAELRGWLRPLLDALAVLHAASCFHRDIAPDNILLTATGPLLLDFGAARRVIGDMTHALTVVLKPGYAPIEQYGEVATMTQGAWTDLYALACVVYCAITGKAPMSSVERMMDDRLVPLATLAAGRYSAPFLHAMDTALALKPQDRPRSLVEFRALLDAGGDAVPAAVVSADAAPAGPAPAAIPVPAPVPVPMPGPTPMPVPAPRPRSKRTATYIVGPVVGLAVLVAAGLYFTGPRRPPAPAVQAPESRPAAPPATSLPAPIPVPEPASAALAESPAPAPIERAPAPRAAAPAAPPPAAPPTVARTAPTRRAQAQPSRCGDLLQKASLEALTPAEAEFIKRECR